MSLYKNETNISLSMAVYLATDEYDRSSDPQEISATSLMRPVKQTILATRIPEEEVQVDVSTLVPSRIGTSIHNGIESAWKNNYEKALLQLGYKQKIIDRIKINPTPEELTDDTLAVYMEQRSKKKVGNWTVTGKFDFVAEGQVEDFKSTKVYTYTMGNKAKDYILQGSIYRWLNPDIITKDTMAIQFIFTDYVAMKAKIEKGYPASNPLTQKFNLLSIPETDKYVKDKLALLDKYFNSPEEDMPPCTDEELWRRDPVWKYYKDPTKMSRSTKNFESSFDAYQRQSQEGKGVVVEVKGEVVACKYCPALSVCKQKNAYILDETLKL